MARTKRQVSRKRDQGMRRQRGRLKGKEKEELRKEAAGYAAVPISRLIAHRTPKEKGKLPTTTSLEFLEASRIRWANATAMASLARCLQPRAGAASGAIALSLRRTAD